MRHLQLIILALVGYVAARSMPWPPGFDIWVGGRSAVIDNHLFLDGGGFNNYYILGSTIVIDLSTSWNVTNVTAVAVDKPVYFPFSQSAWFWPQGNTKLNYRGGEMLYRLCLSPVPCLSDIWFADAGKNGSYREYEENQFQSLWQMSPLFPTSEAAWSNGSDIQPPENIRLAAGNAYTASNEKAYSLGGYFKQYITDEIRPADAYRGFATQDLSTGEWTNTSTFDYGNGNSYSFDGAAIFVPNYGTKGVIITFGGHKSPVRPTAFAGTLASFDLISIYDIGSGRSFHQSATGSAPSLRVRFCTVLVEDANGGGVDIFMYGGQGYTSDYGGDGPPVLKDNFWILSLPSFRWTRGPYDGSAGTTSIIDHTCAVIGNRSMVVVGGSNPNNLDVNYQSDDEFWWIEEEDRNAIGLFDLVTLRWKRDYDASANQVYARNESVVSAIAAQPTPVWADGVQELFTNASGSSPPSGTNSGDSSNSDNSNNQNISNESNDPGNSNTGAIVGGVVGGVAGLVILIVVAVFTYRSRRRKEPQPDDEPEPETVIRAELTTEGAKPTFGVNPLELDGSTPTSTRSELEGLTPVELDSVSPVELDGTSAPAEMPSPKQ